MNTFAQVQLSWTPLEHTPLARPPAASLWYLAEPLPDGRWQCYAGLGLAIDRFWEEPAFLVTSEVLEKQFQIFDGVIEDAALNGLLMRALPGDEKTYAVKDALREMGGLWVKFMRAWAIPVNRYEEACALLEGEVDEDGLFAPNYHRL